MGLIKDLLYSKNNQFLDIARVSAAVSVLAFWGCVITMVVNEGKFDPLAVGGGCAAIFTGAGGWIYARQKQEAVADGPVNA